MNLPIRETVKKIQKKTGGRKDIPTQALLTLPQPIFYSQEGYGP